MERHGFIAKRNLHARELRTAASIASRSDDRIAMRSIPCAEMQKEIEQGCTVAASAKCRACGTSRNRKAHGITPAGKRVVQKASQSTRYLASSPWLLPWRGLRARPPKRSITPLPPVLQERVAGAAMTYVGSRVQTAPLCTKWGVLSLSLICSAIPSKAEYRLDVGDEHE